MHILSTSKQRFEAPKEINKAQTKDVKYRMCIEPVRLPLFSSIILTLTISTYRLNFHFHFCIVTRQVKFLYSKLSCYYHNICVPNSHKYISWLAGIELLLLEFKETVGLLTNPKVNSVTENKSEEL